MLREAGPIPPLDTSWYPTTWDTPDFADELAAALQPADDIFASMDALFDPTVTLDALPTGDTIMTDLDTVDQINGDNAHLAVTDPISNIDHFKADGDTAMVAAIQVIPGEAFEPVPAATQWATQAPAAVTARILSAKIDNLNQSRGGGFVINDNFEIVVQMDTGTGNVNDYFQVQIYGDMTKDGVAQPSLTIGQTDHSGSVTFTGTWQSTDAGQWSMTVHAHPFTGGDVTFGPVNWSVGTLPKNGHGPVAAAVTATVFNYTSGDLGNNHVGDTWQVFVTGPASSPVYMWGSYNGVSLTEATLGTTDTYGNFNLAGTWADSEIGTWVEVYGVGHFQMTGNITFTIKAAGT